MEIQSLSLDVSSICPNNCHYCVSKMHANDYENKLEDINYFDVYFYDFVKQLRFVQKCGCQTVILTGTGEPLYNKKILFNFAVANQHILTTPFERVEIQTSGVILAENLRFLRNTVKVSTISLSLSNMFNDESNADITQTPEKLRFKIEDLCKEIKDYGFNLRLSLNMSDVYNERTAEEIFQKAKDLGANQVTIRVLYSSLEGNTIQDNWIKEHNCNPEKINEIHQYIKAGKKLEVLPFGATKYSILEMGVVLDDDCMATKLGTVAKYAILRPDCNLYTKWDDKGSLI